MKNLTASTMILTVAALTFGVSTVLAQGASKMKAEIPFAFHVGSQEYAAGKYETSVVASNTGILILSITNKDTGVSQMAMSPMTGLPKNDAERAAAPRLVFRCQNTGCALIQLWRADTGTALVFNAPATKRGEPTRLTVVNLRPVAAD